MNAEEEEEEEEEEEGKEEEGVLKATAMNEVQKMAGKARIGCHNEGSRRAWLPMSSNTNVSISFDRCPRTALS